MKAHVLAQSGTGSREAQDKSPPRLVRRILTTSDFSHESKAGTDYAMGLAQKLDASVVLLHVIEALPPVDGLETYVLLSTHSGFFEDARIRLTRIAQQARAKRLHLSTQVRVGKAPSAIVATADQSRSDLVVMATHGYTGFKHALLGSTAEWVVRHAGCSVLTVPTEAWQPPFKGRGFTLRKVLVPLDFSELSKAALPWAAFLAHLFHAEIILVNVTELFPMDHLMGQEMMNHTITPLMRDAEIGLERIGEGFNVPAGVKTSVIARAGVPYKEICRAARELSADLIVLTTHGYTGLKHVWLGSTAERVVRSASCPVLVARAVSPAHRDAAYNEF